MLVEAGRERVWGAGLVGEQVSEISVGVRKSRRGSNFRLEGSKGNHKHTDRLKTTYRCVCAGVRALACVFDLAEKSIKSSLTV